MKKIIVMLSTFNGEKYIDNQLNSIFSQDVDLQIKLLVRDDGSTDSTLDKLRDWMEKANIELIEDGLSLGAANSFWKLLCMAEDADYYAFVDQDDEWDSNKLSEAIKEIGDSCIPVLWFSNCRIIDEHGRVLKNRLKEKNQYPKLTMESELICGSSQGCAMVFNKEALRVVSRYSINTIPMHDIVLMEYIIACGKVIYHEEPLFSYRVHRDNVVAKQGKSIINQIMSSYNRWFKKNKHMYQMMCTELLNNLKDELDDYTKSYLQNVILSRSSFRARLSILYDSRTWHYDRTVLRSFKIRVMLGII